MNASLRELCEQYLRGDLAATDLVQSCLKQASESVATAEVDVDRRDRCGFPEVIYAEGKPDDVLTQIAKSLHARQQPILATRVSASQSRCLLREFPGGRYHDVARTFRVDRPAVKPSLGRVPVVTAGTSDQAVGWEAIETLEWMNVRAIPLFDLGVAGPHRLPAKLDQLRDADAIVVVAGMEGALPSVVGGYVSCPVIAVPTSVGYGANFQGLAALLGMLNSCSANVAVVNIDAGFKAGYLAGLIAARRNSSRLKTPPEESPS